MNYVIIGNSAAGLSAANEIRKNDKISRITILSAEKYYAYGRPMISYYLKGKISLDKVFLKGKDFYKKQKIDIVFDKAISIDKTSKEVNTVSGNSIPYDKLIIATGSEPFIPPMDGLDKQENIYTFFDLDSAIRLKETVTSTSKVVVLGGGLIALKAVEGLRGITSNISVVELADRILPTILDNKTSEKVKAHIEKKDIKFYLGNTIIKIVGNKKVDKVILKDGTELEANILVVAVGVRPETGLAREIGIKCNRGISINAKCETNVNDIYAVGDVTEIYDYIDEKEKIIALWPHAVEAGRVAGANASGKEAVLDRSFPYNAIDFFGLRMITAGIITPTKEYSVKVIEDETGFSSFVIKDDELKGYILLGNVDRAGLFTDIIRNGYKLSSLDGVLEKRTFLSYNETLRRAKYEGKV